MFPSHTQRYRRADTGSTKAELKGNKRKSVNDEVELKSTHREREGGLYTKPVCAVQMRDKSPRECWATFVCATRTQSGGETRATAHNWGYGMLSPEGNALGSAFCAAQAIKFHSLIIA